MKKLNIPYVNLSKQWRVEKATLLKIIDKVIETQDWVGGTEIKKFETSVFDGNYICGSVTKDYLTNLESDRKDSNKKA